MKFRPKTTIIGSHRQERSKLRQIRWYWPLVNNFRFLWLNFYFVLGYHTCPNPRNGTFRWNKYCTSGNSTSNQQHVDGTVNNYCKSVYQLLKTRSHDNEIVEVNHTSQDPLIVEKFQAQWPDNPNGILFHRNVRRRVPNSRSSSAITPLQA